METTMDVTPVPDYAGLTRLDGKVFVVIGGGQGIGRQVSHALAQSGARVVVVDAVGERAAAVATEVDGASMVADVTVAAQVEGLFDGVVASEGRVDGVVDIVGISRFLTIEETTEEDWDRLQTINLKQGFLVIKAAGRVMRAGSGGSIVMISSISGVDASQRHSAYGAAKAALISLVKSAAVEYGPYGIRVNSVAPGVIWTDRIGGAIGDHRRAEWTAGTPTGRLGESSDIASSVLFFASALSQHVNGQTLVVDGGRKIRFEYPIEAI
ncbi:MAG: SDR family oxidoreductase [Micrococcales bacterium]|nr:SDR family oxidoreductase [Micrococcales bacterium]